MIWMGVFLPAGMGQHVRVVCSSSRVVKATPR
jgi:hypothetical protein